MLLTNHRLLFLFASLLLFVTACKQEQVAADLILTNADIYTVDPDQPTATALAIKDGRILAIGDEATIEEYRSEATEVMDLDGKFVMPGFIEGHGHFSGLGYGLMNLNFLQAKSWDEIVQMVAEKAAETPDGEWITGRGWHQEKWTTAPELAQHGYPSHHTLSVLTKDHPVVLRHASGHSLFANEAAMKLAGVTAETPDPRGGHILKDNQGQPIGVFEERAMSLINEAYAAYRDGLSPQALVGEWQEGIELAQKECLAKGVTSFQDAGSSFQEIEDYQKLAEAGELDLRLWVMARLSYNKLAAGLGNQFPVVDAGDHFFTCRAIKSEVDGALGAFGAWLLEPYDDKPDFIGQNTTLLETVDSIAGLAIDKKMQLCVHAIGDRANQEVLNLFEKRFAENGEQDYRWRIEHSQHLAVEDIPRFAELGVIASMQAIHCTSDAPFVEKRLGTERARTGAYPWRSLLDAGAIVTNGTDVPVEDVDPLASYYATVTRKRPDSGMEFFPEQAMTREEGIYSYTMANAYAAFEENDKGSLSPGKLADIVVLSNNLLSCSEAEIMETKVLTTIVNGEVKYQRNEK
ncbi:amidohydrolase [Lewinella cohaerens]|uniref:amidohydrolase n=1 Tax=Lewinella cohaerens TaxID=70995 RepID=UPI0003782C55|nr:amidohydrolase [Lewinella cohaerens]